MSIHDSEKLPSGRNKKRLKQDAKKLAKDGSISHVQALDMLAKSNGVNEPWCNLINLPKYDHYSQKAKNIEQPSSRLAQELGITDDLLDLLSWEVDENCSEDGLVYCYILTFHEGSPPEILSMIQGISEHRTARVSVNAFDDDQEPDEEKREQFTIKTEMNPYRKLLVLGLNELLTRGLLSLEWDGSSNEEVAHIETTIAGHNTIIAWQGVGYGEVRLSVWWKYDHAQHPQAHLSYNSRESFCTPAPLAKKQHYPKFVGVVASAWLERKCGKYLQGKNNKAIFDQYARKGELQNLRGLQNPTPQGFFHEGAFHM